MVRLGMASQARPVAVRLRGVCHGVVGHRRQGMDRCDRATHGEIWQATYGTARFGKEGYGIAGLVRRVAVG